jgi:hypothetical protein
MRIIPILLFFPVAAAAQETRPLPTHSGQEAFATIGEVARILQRDSTTDWNRVNIEALRQHLIDMNDVTLHATIIQKPVERGMSAEVIGTGRTESAIRRMLVTHSAAMRMTMPDVDWRTDEIAGGIRWTVTSKTGDARTIAQLRGLGAIGLLTLGDHHAAHHLAIARGEPMAGHMHPE